MTPDRIAILCTHIVRVKIKRGLEYNIFMIWSNISGIGSNFVSRSSWWLSPMPTSTPRQTVAENAKSGEKPENMFCDRTGSKPVNTKSLAHIPSIQLIPARILILAPPLSNQQLLPDRGSCRRTWLQQCQDGAQTAPR